jgi:hypothetical protein
MMETLNQYSGVPKIISQWHLEYSASAWGTLKLLLVIPMSYINLTQRTTVMLENGGNLPDFLLYQRLPTTSRVSQIISKLYAAVTEFLLYTIVYFHRRGTRRYFRHCKLPFEAGFNDETMEKIRLLRVAMPALQR